MTRIRLLLLLAGLAIVPVLLALAMLGEARSVPVVRRAELAVAGLAPATRVRVVLLADIHVGTLAMDGARLARIVGQVNALHPDLVLIAGDLIEGGVPGSATRLAPELVGPLSRLRARLGSVAVLGNHDHDTGAAAVAAGGRDRAGERGGRARAGDGGRDRRRFQSP